MRDPGKALVERSLSAMTVLQAERLRKEYGTLVAVDDVSLSLEKGDVLGLIGPNGAGKTTLLRILATLVRPTSGRTRVLGRDLVTEYLVVRKRIGFLPDFFNLYGDLTLRESLRFFAEAYEVPPEQIAGRVDKALEYIDLRDKQDSLVRHLSRGMVQRTGIGIRMVHDPDLFLLDEPASGLDPKARIQLRDIIRKLSSEGKTIVISSHILTELAGFCSHVAIMEKGRIRLFGAVDDIQHQVAGARRVCVSVFSDGPRAAEVAGRFPDARVTTIHENTLTVELSGDVRQMAALNTHLVKEGIEVTGFSEQKVDLEELFMRISGQAEPKQ
jgi:ABC-2 type transport system ATP-binding protein